MEATNEFSPRRFVSRRDTRRDQLVRAERPGMQERASSRARLYKKVGL